MRFTKRFGLPHDQPQLDFVDIDNNEDIPLFFDPYVFSNSADQFSRACTADIQSYFGTVLQLIKDQNREEAIALLSKLNEPNELCMGFSKGRPSGRGVGLKQAGEMYQRLSESEAGKSGQLSDLSDCELFIDGFGPDKISDITANIIRGQLVDYTQRQCDLHGITALKNVAMGPIWDKKNLRWSSNYVDLPVMSKGPVLLVPKKVVRWLGDLSHQHHRYYQHFVLNFLKDENLRSNTSLVRVIKSKKHGERRVVFKKDVAKENPISKDFLFRFSRDNPKVFQAYKDAFKKTKALDVKDLSEDFDTSIFCDALIDTLKKIPEGNKHADEFHQFMVGALEFIFYPDLTNPCKEAPLFGGRKRIDIRFDNAADQGFFYRLHAQKKITAIWVVIECKNYSSDPQNPEIDQISGRFGANFGWFGILVARHFTNRKLFVKRCRDTASSSRGWVIPFVDDDIVALLKMIKRGKRSEIDAYLSKAMGELT